MKKRDETGDTLYVLPFLLVCGFFVWFGWEELGPGAYGVVWTAIAGGFTLYAAFHMLLAKKPGRVSGGERVSDRSAPDGTDTADRGEPGAAGGPEAGEPEASYTPYSPETDSLMEDVDRILGKEGMEAAKLVRVTQSDEQRARLGELAALYELRSIGAEEYQRRRREILEET